MAGDQKKKAILDDIFSTTIPSSNAELDEMATLLTSPLISLGKGKGELAVPAETIDAAQRVKTTCYLSGSNFDRLNNVRVVLDKLLSKIINGRITRSRIIDLAIGAMLDDFEKNGKNSSLIREFLLQKTR